MATSYSNLLGLALPVQGELSGTWGDTVNAYITNYLDAAIAGTQSISGDADTTLTKTTGASLGSTSSQYAVLNCTGARTAQRTIIAPASSKVYVVINATTGGFGVKVAGPGPTTGVVIQAGTQAQVAWTGADFVVIGVTLLNKTNNGVAYVDSSGNLTSGAALTFDGTTFGVTATSTTTPALKLYYNSSSLYGQHSMNANGDYVVSSPAANGVTSGNLLLNGQPTFGGILFSLNSSEQMRLTSAGLGIGTASPGAKLHVNGWVRSGVGASAAGGFEMPDNGSSAGSRTWRVRNDVNAYGDFSIQTATALGGTTFVDRVNLDPSGNLGLGVVPSAWGSGYKSFEGGSVSNGVQGAVTFFNTAQNGVALYSNSYNNGTNDVYKYSFSAAKYTIVNNQHSWFTAPSGTAGGAITFTQAMTLDASGNLLVGTTSALPGNSAYGIFGNSSASGANRWAAYFGANSGSSGNPGSFGLTVGWNKSAGDGETNLVYGSSLGGAPGLQISSFNGTTLSTQFKLFASGGLYIGATPTDPGAGNLAVTGTVTGTNLYAQSQTWQNVTGSRAIGTSYTNSTARPIEVQTSVASAGGTVNFYMNMNGTYIRVGVAVAGSSECAITVTVPPGQTYGVSTANGSMSSAGAGALAGWNELR